MAATVATYFYYGVGATPPSDVVVTNLRFKLADNNDQDANNPCVKPSAGTNYSWWKHIALYCTVAPDTAINNIKLYTDGSLAWAGCTMYVGDQTLLFNQYDQGETGGADTGAEMVANHTNIASKTDLFTYASGSPMSISGSIAYTTGRITNLVVLQVNIGTGAGAGQMPQETLTWRYDET